MNTALEINKLEKKILQLEKIAEVQSSLEILKGHWMKYNSMGFNMKSIEGKIGVTERRIENLIKHYNK